MQIQIENHTLKLNTYKVLKTLQENDTPFYPKCPSPDSSENPFSGFFSQKKIVADSGK
ncbi:hypothetical protein [Flavobacterium limi]|uniref:hypothetical protein n=1 Tax=Flavobacterium limi TaxID=2045105 RepID=UPI0013D5AB61|nr:hypothetical protein [Flavobacterium limi]